MSFSDIPNAETDPKIIKGLLITVMKALWFIRFKDFKKNAT